MAKTNIRGLGKWLDRVRDAVSHFDDDFYKELGTYVITRIQAQARSGRKMSQGKQVRFPALKSEAYIEQRKRMQKRGEVDPEFFSPKRSNITLTGQYVRSLEVTKIDKGSRTLMIEPTGTRKGERLTNKELAKHLADMSRDIFGLDETGRKVLTQKVLRKIRTDLKRNLKLK